MARVNPNGLVQFGRVQATNGQELVFAGSHLEVTPFNRLVNTVEIDAHGNPVTTTVELRWDGASTGVTLTNLCASKEVREPMVKHRAEAGAMVALAQLAKLIEVPERGSP